MSLNNAECPVCGDVAKTFPEVQDRFGIRIFRGRKYVQSYCRKCRVEERREKRLR